MPREYEFPFERKSKITQAKYPDLQTAKEHLMEAREAYLQYFKEHPDATTKKWCLDRSTDLNGTSWSASTLTTISNNSICYSMEQPYGNNIPRQDRDHRSFPSRTQHFAGSLLASLVEAINHAGENEEAKVVILKVGRSYLLCGCQFPELIHIDNAATGEGVFSGFANVINAMRKCPKFIIGRIQGKTVGGGVGLASATGVHGHPICSHQA